MSLDSGPVQALAAKYGLDTAQLSQGLASVLPQLIDKATRDGTVSSGHAALLQQGVSALLGVFGRGGS